VSWDLRPGQRLSMFVLGSRERTDAVFDEESTSSSLGLGNEASNNLVSLALARRGAPVRRRGQWPPGTATATA